MTNLQQLREEGDKEFEKKFVSKSHISLWGTYKEKPIKAIKGEIEVIEKIKDYIHQREDKAYALGQQDMLERVREIIAKEMDKRANIETVQFLACDDLACEILKALNNLN